MLFPSRLDKFFSRESLPCVNPCLQANRYVVHDPAYFDRERGWHGMPNGTLSLALKHKLASLDMLARHLPSALIVEDDAMLPVHLWSALGT